MEKPTENQIWNITGSVSAMIVDDEPIMLSVIWDRDMLIRYASKMEISIALLSTVIEIKIHEGVMKIENGRLSSKLSNCMI